MTSLCRKILILILLLNVCGGCSFEKIEKRIHQYENNAADSRLTIMDVSSKFIENKQVGRLFVITGNVKNNYPDPRCKMRIRCKLYNKRRILAKQDSVYAGVIISEEELRTGSVDKIKKRLSTPQKSIDTVIYALPEKKLSFMVVFSDLPKDLNEFSFETPSSAPFDLGNRKKSIDSSPKNITDNDVRINAQERKIKELVKHTVYEPDDLDAWRHLGNLYFDTDQISKAIQAYEKSLALGPDQEDVWTDLGVMYRRNNQPEKAVQCFDSALTIKADHQIALYNKGIVLIKDFNDRKGALTAWQKLVQVNPQARTPRGDLVKDLLSRLKDSN